MIVEVALNLPLRRVFDYRVPPEAQGAVRPGSRVIVSFGKRVISGIVAGVKETSALPEARLKTLVRLESSVPLFSEELLGFTGWVADYYFSAWGEVLEAALPSGMGVKFATRFRLRQSPQPLDAPPGVHMPEPNNLNEGLVALLNAGEAWDEAQWKKLARSEAETNWLAQQIRPGGMIEVEYVYAGTKSRHLTERWVRLGGHPPPVKRRNPKRETRAEMVMHLLRTEGEAPMARLKAVVKDPGAVVRELEKVGAVEVFERKKAPRLWSKNGEAEAGAEAVQQAEAEAQGEGSPGAFLTLNDEQQQAADRIREALKAADYKAFLLEGVTGSGKTEVYLHAVRETLALGRSVLILVPEIALTSTMVGRFRDRFGADVAVLHSGMGEGERFEEWNRVRAGEARIVVGARSAVFAPLHNLGLIVVDEEHDGSYKQDETPRYNGRDVAMVRAYRNKAVAILGSATPSLESTRNVQLGKLERLCLNQRVEQRPLPPVELLDMRSIPRQAGSAYFSLPLLAAMREALAREEQCILFLNRRGFASMARCDACQETMLCVNCSITLTYHQYENRLRCHRCDYNQVLPKKCPACDAENLSIVGIGTERVEQEVAMMFPRARVLRMDSDTLRRKGELDRMMQGIRERRFDIIIGTQVLSKGHDFPYITLVGAVLADISMNLPDFRAPERTFQLLTQMAGRAGRGEREGRVLIQTYNPDHYSLVHVKNHDAAGFSQAEVEIRAQSSSPPYSSQVLVWISSPEASRAERLASQLATSFREAATKEVLVLGSVEAPIRRLNNRYRYMIALRAATVHPLHRALRAVLDNPRFKITPKERISVDVDPYNLM